MDSYIKKIDLYLKFNKNLPSSFQQCAKTYLHTTENISGFLNYFELINKNILTIAGSGDQMLNSYLLGARQVTCFDINLMALTQVKLKKAAICGLTYDEYIDFFFIKVDSTNNNILDINLFKKIKPYLDIDTIKLFEYLYKRYSKDFIINAIYYDFPNIFDSLFRLNNYLTKENYDKLSNILKENEPIYIESDLLNLKDKLNDNYDLILLSNISDYIEKMYDSNILENFKELILTLNNNLNKNGSIQVGYIYDYYNDKHEGIFSYHNKRKKIFNSSEFMTLFFDSFYDKNKKDACITYYKK